MESQSLGLEAYSRDEPNVADLLQNLEGCRVHGVAPGTGEHAGTGLLKVELPTGEGLGLQIPMDTDEQTIPTRTATQTDTTWEVEATPSHTPLDRFEANTPDTHILEVVHHNIMDPETAEVVLILSLDIDNTVGVNLHLVNGGVEFFSVSV